MKACFVIPSSYEDRIRTVVRDNFRDIHDSYLIYNEYHESPRLIADKQKQFDMIFFAGEASYVCCENLLPQETTWGYFPRLDGSILRAMIEAMQLGWDIRRISFDLFSPDQLQKLYRELGHPEIDLKCNYTTRPSDMLDMRYVDNVAAFHRDHYRAGHTVGVITRLMAVKKKLDKLGLPCIFAYPTYNDIKEQIALTRRFCYMKSASRISYAAIHVYMNLPDEYSFLSAGNYHLMLEQNRLAEQIYRYADLVKGVVVRQSSREYLIISDSPTVEEETGHFRNFKLLQWLSSNTPYRISLGIGLGENFAAAQEKARIAMRRSQESSAASSAVIAYPSGDYRSLYWDDGTEKTDNWDRIAERSGLSKHSVMNIHQLLNQRKSTRITSKELAQGLGISSRSADRILEKLDLAGYAFQSGTVTASGAGRPSRVWKIQFSE